MGIGLYRPVAVNQRESLNGATAAGCRASIGAEDLAQQARMTDRSETAMLRAVLCSVGPADNGPMQPVV